MTNLSNQIVSFVSSNYASAYVPMPAIVGHLFVTTKATDYKAFYKECQEAIKSAPDLVVAKGPGAGVTMRGYHQAQQEARLAASVPAHILAELEELRALKASLTKPAVKTAKPAAKKAQKAA